MTDEERTQRRALLVGAIAAALGVGLPACGAGAGKGAASPAASGSTSGVTEVPTVRERPMRDAHCGRD